MTAAIVAGLIVIVVLFVLSQAIKIVREYQRVVLFRLGRALGTRGPGLVFIIPVFDRVTWVDLREKYLRTTRRSRSTSSSSTKWWTR